MMVELTFENLWQLGTGSSANSLEPVRVVEILKSHSLLKSQLATQFPYNFLAVSLLLAPF